MTDSDEPAKEDAGRPASGAEPLADAPSPVDAPIDAPVEAPVAAPGEPAAAPKDAPKEDAPKEDVPKEPAPYAPPRSEAAEAKPWRPSYVFLAAVTIINLGLDLWTKHWAKTYFEELRPIGERKIVIIDQYVSLIFAKNRGGAWGLLQNETEALRRPFFLVVSVAAIVFIVSLYRKLNPGQRALKWGLPLVLGGALGNLIDRIRYGYVIDFIDVYMKLDGQMKHWPTFNVADIAICVGVALMAIDMFSPRRDKAKKAIEKPPVVEERSPTAAPTLLHGSDPKGPELPGGESTPPGDASTPAARGS